MGESSRSEQAKDAASKLIDKGKNLRLRPPDAVTQRPFHDEVLARFGQIVEVLVAQHAELEGLRKRVEELERG